MANKAHNSRQKLTFRVTPAKPRNPLALLGRRRAGGPHGKSTSAKRALQARILKKSLKDDE